MSCVVTRLPHALMVIDSRPTGEGPGIEVATRWCVNCGAIVIDVDVDGQTDPGRAMPMLFPRLARETK